MRDSIRNFILENLTIFEEATTLNDDDDIFKQGFVDSLFALKLVQMVEKEFGISVANEDLRLSNFNSVNNIAKFVESKNT